MQGSWFETKGWCLALKWRFKTALGHRRSTGPVSDFLGSVALSGLTCGNPACDRRVRSQGVALGFSKSPLQG